MSKKRGLCGLFCIAMGFLLVLTACDGSSDLEPTTGTTVDVEALREELSIEASIAASVAEAERASAEAAKTEKTTQKLTAAPTTALRNGTSQELADYRAALIDVMDDLNRLWGNANKLNNTYLEYGFLLTDAVLSDLCTGSEVHDTVDSVALKTKDLKTHFSKLQKYKQLEEEHEILEKIVNTSLEMGNFINKPLSDSYEEYTKEGGLYRKFLDKRKTVYDGFESLENCGLIKSSQYYYAKSCERESLRVGLDW